MFLIKAIYDLLITYIPPLVLEIILLLDIEHTELFIIIPKWFSYISFDIILFYDDKPIKIPSQRLPNILFFIITVSFKEFPPIAILAIRLLFIKFS